MNTKNPVRIYEMTNPTTNPDLIIEEWRAVRGFEGYYEISNHGRVRSLDRTVQTARGPQKHKGQMMALCPNRCGYASLTFFKGGKRTVKKAHRLVAEAFLPNPEGKEEVNHIDSNRFNNHISNLEWVTRSENMVHGYKKGKMSNKGLRNPFSKLKPKDVYEIIRLHEVEGLTIAQITKKFSIKHPTVRAILRREPEWFAASLEE